MRSPSSSVARFRCIWVIARKKTAFFTLAMPTATSTKKNDDVSTSRFETAFYGSARAASITYLYDAYAGLLTISRNDPSYVA